MSSPFPPTPFPPPSPPDNATSIHPSSALWIGDLLFRRRNRSLKYAQDGTLLIMANSVDLAEIASRMVGSMGLPLMFFAVAIVLNFCVLFLSLGKVHRQTHFQKVQFLLGSLAICNIGLASGLLAYTFLLDIYYHVDSFDTLLHLLWLPGPHHLAFSLWHFTKFLIHTELVENFLLVQHLVLLLASLDRYLSQLGHYTINVRSPVLFTLLSAIPFLIGLILLDRRIIQLWTCEQTANRIRLFALLCPPLLSLVFAGSSLVSLLQQRHALRRVFGPAFFQDEMPLSLSLFAMICLDSLAKFGLFLELLSASFGFQISIRPQNNDPSSGSTILSIYYSLSHWALMGSPLLHALLTLACVGFYRRRLFSHLSFRIFARPKPTVDYACETMRSIIAEQSRARQMRMGTRRGGISG